jgi:MoaA/NifB/PqqE/SkfB family radical SAM enzyme
MNNICYYSLTGINYKNQFVTSCAINSDRLIRFSESILPSKIYNSENFKSIRKQLHSGKWPSGCHLCKDVEKNPNAFSMRQDYLFEDGKFEHEKENFVYDFYDPLTGFMNPKGCRHIEMRFSNVCNMSCLHCSSVFSTGWQKKLETYEIDEEDKSYNLEQLLNTLHIDSDDDKKRLGLGLNDIKKICNDLNTNFPNIDRVELSGGELLIQRQFYKFLELLSDHPNRKNITISFYSNFNADFDIEYLTKLLNNFGKSVISISIDSSENIYPYFRDGNWKVLKDNILKFRKINNFTQLNGVVTFSAYQFMDIYNIYKSIIPLNLTNIKTSLVQSPKYLNPCVLLFDYEKELREDFEDTQNLIMDIYKDRIENIHKFEKENAGVVVEKFENWVSKDLIVDHKHRFRKQYLNGDYIFSDLDSGLWYLNNIGHYIFNKKNSKYMDYNAFLIYIKKSDKHTNQNFNDYFTKFKYMNNEIVRI